MAQLTVLELAFLCGGELAGDGSQLISGANILEDATASDLSFAENEKALEKVNRSTAGCVLVPATFTQSSTATLIRVSKPRLAFAALLKRLYPANYPTVGTHVTAIIDSSARLGYGVSIGAYVTIGAGSTIGDNTVIAPGCRIGANVAIGADSALHSNVTLYDNVRIGSRTVLHSGCVIGADGFGWTFVEDHFEKFPQVGTVEIGDDVELGANCCVDRAALGATRIGNGTKLDNLVHVAHNCTIGRHVVIAAQTGFSGSVTVGDYARIGGQAGIGEKARIDAKSIVGGKAGILTSQHITAGEPVWGIPARPLKQHLRGLAHVTRLPKTEGEVKELRKRLSALERQERQPANSPQASDTLDS